MNAARINSARSIVESLCCASAAFAALIARASRCAPKDWQGRFEVRSADLELQDGVYHLNARIDLPISEAVRRGLVEGVPLTLEVDLDIERVRQLLPNSRVAELTQRYRLQYNAVSARYILRNENSGQQESLGTIDEAIAHLSEVHSLPVLDKALIAADRRYEGRVQGQDRFRHRAIHAAAADVLGQRLASRVRLVRLDVPAMIRKYGSTVLGCIGVALWLAALFMLASAVQNSEKFAKWLPWILLVNICRPAHFVRPAGRQARAPGARLSQARAGLPFEGPHRGDLQRAGGGADPGGLLFRAAVLESRHRQLVRERGQPGIERHARVVACGSRGARARIPAAHASGRALA